MWLPLSWPFVTLFPSLPVSPRQSALLVCQLQRMALVCVCKDRHSLALTEMPAPLPVNQAARAALQPLRSTAVMFSKGRGLLKICGVI